MCRQTWSAVGWSWVVDESNGRMIKETMTKARAQCHPRKSKCYFSAGAQLGWDLVEASYDSCHVDVIV